MSSLRDHIDVTFQASWVIGCDVCEETSSDTIEECCRGRDAEQRAEREAIRQGWSILDGDVVCPVCAVKGEPNG